MAIENISQDLSDLLATKNFEVKYTDAKGQDSSPEEAKVFAFDWVASSGKNYGTVVIVLGDDNDFQVFFGDNLGKTMEDPEDKLDWFGSERHTGFLEELSRFAIGRRYNFSPKNINQLKHTMQGMAAIKEGLFEGYYGTRHISYMGERTEARLMIKHNRMIGEDDKRYRYVESLFIETADGERFRLPFTKLTGGRAMLEHVRQGGKPYDIRGQHINEVVTEMAVLSRFNRASHGRVFEGITEELVESVTVYYQDLQENLKHMATTRGYAKYFESWTPADIGESTALVEDLKTLFIEQTLDARIEAALPTLAKIQHRGRAMKEAQIFENWVNNLVEGTWALPDTPEAQAKLDELMSKELIVGPDATNATEQLYDIIGDDELFDILHDLAENDPRANIWDDTDVQARLQELGIQMNTTPAADQQQPVAPAAGQQAPGTAPEQAVREGAQPTEKVSDVIKRVMGDILIFEPGVSKLYKNTRRSRTQRVDDYKMELIGVEDPAVEKGKGYFSARDGHPLAKKLKRALIQAGYPVYDDLLIFPNGIMFQVRTPITTTAEQGVAEGLVKDIKRAAQGWGGVQDKPADIVKRIKSYDTDTAKKLRAHLDDAPDHTPAGLQKRVLDRKLKGVAEGLEPTEKVSAVIKRVLGDKLLWGRRISQLIKSPRANFDRYQMLHIRVYDDFGGPNELIPEPFSADEGQPLAKKLKRELIKAGYPVSSDLVIYPEAIMFNVRKPTTTAEQGVAEGEYKSRHIHRQEQNKKYDEYRRNQEAAGKKPLSRGDWAATQRKGQQGVAEGSTTRGGFGGSASQAYHEIEWLKKKIASLPPTKEKQIRDLQRQIRERELAIAFQKEGVAEGAGNIGAQIRAAYQRIDDQGDDAVEFAYYDSPIFAQYWDEYEGDLDSIIAEVDPSELQIILDELTSAAEDQGVAEAIVGKPRYSEPHQSGRGLYSAADYMVRTKHQLGSHVYTAVTQVDADNDRYYFIYQKGNKEPVFYATDMGQFEVRTDNLGNRVSNAIITAHKKATDHDLEKYMSGDDESEWDQEKNMAEGLNEMDKSQDPPGRDGGHQFPPGPKVSKKVIKAVEKDPAKHLQDLFAKEYSKKKVKEQGVAEGNELGQMLKHAGVLVKESMPTDSTGETLDHILNRFKNEVKRFQNGDEIDTELYYALFDYYNDHGEMPYGVAKARDGDPVNWISDKLTAELGIDENLIAAQSMPVTTESSTCNMTTEGEYCPEHGLAECGYMEDMAPVVMDEAPQDAINYNAAVTGAYYESKEGDALLARIKSLALLK